MSRPLAQAPPLPQWHPFMRTAFLPLAALLAASCGAETSSGGGGSEGGDERIECALDGSPAFERVCTVERRASEQGMELVVRAPDGAFRRLLVTNDGRGVVAADGAVPAVVSVVSEGMIEVSLAEDRYRLPATIKAAPQPGQ